MDQGTPAAMVRIGELHRCGWRVAYLGASTPIAELAGTALESGADVVVFAATVKEHFDGLTDGLAQLVCQVPLALAGAGATQALADATGGRLLTADPVTEAQRLPFPPANRRTSYWSLQCSRSGLSVGPPRR